ncbi:MAG TPA: hypothetical protein VD929_04345 [Caulobacteraceae bacterium]|nr:hypothetical protein [Caulobacteraceae bacterium]
MGIFKRYYEKGKEYVRRSSDQVKEFGRRTADTRVKITRVGTAVGAGALAFVPGLGVVLAPAAAALGATANRYNASTAARHEGKTGRDARKAGRAEFVRTGVYGGVGAALGIGASAALGAGTFQSAPGAYSYGAGQSHFGAVAPGTSANAAAELTMANYAAAGGPQAFGVTPSAGGFAGSLGNIGKAAGAAAAGAKSAGGMGAGAGASGGLLNTLGKVGSAALEYGGAAGGLVGQAAGILKGQLPPGVMTPPFNPGGQTGGHPGGGDVPGGGPGGESGFAGFTRKDGEASGSAAPILLGLGALLLLRRAG